MIRPLVISVITEMFGFKSPILFYAFSFSPYWLLLLLETEKELKRPHPLHLGLEWEPRALPLGRVAALGWFLAWGCLVSSTVCGEKAASLCSW